MTFSVFGAKKNLSFVKDVIHSFLTLKYCVAVYGQTMQSTKDDSVHRGGGFARIHHGHHQGHHKYTTNHYLMSSIMQDHRVHTIPKLSSLHVNKNDEDANTW